MYKYPGMKKKMGEFELAIVAGEFTDSEIMVMLGENGKPWGWEGEIGSVIICAHGELTQG